MPRQKLITIVLYAAVATSLGSATQADIQMPDFAVHARFDLTNPGGGPFPSDRFTEFDPSNLTGRRVNLPLPDCSTHPDDCEDIAIINTLDGFNLQPRIAIPFDGPIDAATVTSETVFLVRLDDAHGDGNRTPEFIGINQIVWDVATNTLYAESDELLDQHARYALFVKRGVRDVTGNLVGPSEAFRGFRHAENPGQSDDWMTSSYRWELIRVLAAAQRAGIQEHDIIVASVFTTQSITAPLERIRHQMDVSVLPDADFQLGFDGGRTVFPVNTIAGITSTNQTRTDGSLPGVVTVPVSFLQLVPGSVGHVAFGKYVSPNYLTPEVVIPPVGTRVGSPAIQSWADVYFNLYIPSGTPSAAGWPVAIFGHGRNGDKNFSMRVAATMASRGIATLSINAVGHGFGPYSAQSVTQTDGTRVTFPAGGRSVDQNGDGAIGPSEGWTAAATHRIVGERDGNRQTVVDLMQLARVIQHGLDVDGDHVPDLDGSQIFYFGFSMGGIQGASLLAVDPTIAAGVLNSPGAGGDLTIAELSPLPVGRPTLGAFLAARVPSLLNSPGLASFGGVAVGPPYFNENLPLRDQAAVINTVDGATDIQQLLDNTEWVRQAVDPAAFAVHLRNRPLYGVSEKPMIIQFAKGDQNIPNPLATAILRAGQLDDRAVLFRNDLAFAENPAMPKNPHRFMVNVEIPAARAFALAAQHQIADFFASGGTLIVHPEPIWLFEMPIVRQLEDLSFIP
jgi:Bacterial virulence factor lipase N-terminal